MSFKDLGLNEKTIQAIEDLGYAEPTTVQKDVIPSILEGKDIFTIAPAACGKTCAYIFPLIDIISQKKKQNILILTADSAESVNISDKFSIFNKYHETKENSDEDSANEANVIIASPSLLLENIAENSVDISDINILVVDDINLIKKKRQLPNLEKILELLPVNKQNIVFTTRRSKETQDTLNKILKTPAEIKIDKNKQSELNHDNQNEPTFSNVVSQTTPLKEKHSRYQKREQNQDKKAFDLAKKHKVFGNKTPSFLLADTKLVEIADS